MVEAGCEVGQRSSFQPVMCFSFVGSPAEECQGPMRFDLSLAVCLSLCVSVCSSRVSIDPRRVESGDGAVARGHASRWSSVLVFPKEASKCGFSYQGIQIIQFNLLI